MIDTQLLYSNPGIGPRQRLSPTTKVLSADANPLWIWSEEYKGPLDPHYVFNSSTLINPQTLVGDFYKQHPKTTYYHLSSCVIPLSITMPYAGT